MVAELLVEVGTGGEAADGGDEGDRLVGGEEQADSVLYAVAVDETAGTGVVGTGADSLLHVEVIGEEHSRELVAVQRFVSVRLLTVHQLAETVVELLPSLLN